MDGVLNVNKASGPTSHDVVDDVRRLFGLKRVGHAGTLDPLASGVLVVCLGKATRIVEYLMGGEKEYRAEITFGVTTDTLDSTGTILEERDCSSITREALDQAVAPFVGEIEQIPPMVSAVKHDGQRLYKLAREGKTVERQPRRVTIHSIEVSSFGPSPDHASQITDCKCAEMIVRCSSGTYIRTLCADIGERLGCGAHMSMLERSGVGRFTLAEAVTVEDLRRARDEGRLESLVTDIDDALADMHAVTISDEDATRLMHGLTVPCVESLDSGETIRVHSPAGDLLAIGQIAQDRAALVIKPHKVLAPTPSAQHPVSADMAGAL